MAFEVLISVVLASLHASHMDTIPLLFSNTPTSTQLFCLLVETSVLRAGKTARQEVLQDQALEPVCSGMDRCATMNRKGQIFILKVESRSCDNQNHIG